MAKWMVDDLSEAERSSLDSENQELQELRVVVDDIADWSLSPVKNAAFRFADQENEPLKKGRHLKTNAWLAIAACVSLLVIGYWGWQFLSVSEEVYQTQIGETINIALPDSSKVTLDATSRLAYIEDGFSEKRSVDLDGQAYFEVISGSGFTVATQIGQVKVIGTRFNVFSAKNTFEVSCYEGSVQVSSGGKRLVLEKGEYATLEGGNLIKNDMTGDKPGWSQGYLEYNRASLQVICDDLSRYYEVELQLPDKFKNLRYTGKIPLNNFSGALRRLFVPLEIEYTLTEDEDVSF